MYDPAALKVLLADHEGYSRKLYKCPAGKWTIGIGHNIQDKGLRDEVIQLIFELDMKEAEDMLNTRAPWWKNLNDVRQLVLMDMAFNMGSRLFTFVNTLAAMRRGDYSAAAKGMRASKWAKQVGARAERLATLMEKGTIL